MLPRNQLQKSASRFCIRWLERGPTDNQRWGSYSGSAFRGFRKSWLCAAAIWIQRSLSPVERLRQGNLQSLQAKHCACYWRCHNSATWWILSTTRLRKAKLWSSRTKHRARHWRSCNAETRRIFDVRLRQGQLRLPPHANPSARYWQYNNPKTRRIPSTVIPGGRASVAASIWWTSQIPVNF